MNFLSDLKYVKSYKNRISVCLFVVTTLGLRCCRWAFSSWGEWGLLFAAACGVSIAVASLVEHSLYRLQ